MARALRRRVQEKPRTPRDPQPVLAQQAGQSGTYSQIAECFLLGGSEHAVLIERFDVGESGDRGHCLGL
jgi:hypothetical protein